MALTDIRTTQLLLNNGALLNPLGIREFKYGKVLKLAVVYGSYETVELLLRQPPEDVDITMPNGKYGQVFLLAMSNTERSLEECNHRIELLVENGADVNLTTKKDKLDISPLKAAAHFGWMSTVNLLLDHGAKIIQVGPGGILELAWLILNSVKREYNRYAPDIPPVKC